MAPKVETIKHLWYQKSKLPNIVGTESQKYRRLFIPKNETTRYFWYQKLKLPKITSKRN